MVKIWGKVRSAVTLLCGGLTISGCTMTFEKPYDEFVVIDRPVGKKKIPLAIGLYFSPEFLAHEYISGGRGTETRFPLGQACADILDGVFSNAFETVRFVETRPPLAADALPVVATIEPRIEMFFVEQIDLGNRRARLIPEIELLLKFYDIYGVPVLSRTIVGRATEARKGDSAVWAMEEAGRNLMGLLYRDPELQSWLAGLR